MTTEQIARHFNIDDTTAATVLGIIRGTVDPCEASSDARAWVDRCHHRPGTREIQLRALVQVLDGSGDEAIWGRDEYQPVAAYVNTGDTYSPTIILDYIAARWRLSTFGDFIERFERKYQIA
jgi:hypothetical protein